MDYYVVLNESVFEDNRISIMYLTSFLFSIIFGWVYPLLSLSLSLLIICALFVQVNVTSISVLELYVQLCFVLGLQFWGSLVQERKIYSKNRI